MNDPRRHAPATARNREPILGVLSPIVKPGALVLEIASGSGEHAAFFAAQIPACTWQPSDPDAGARESIAAWVAGSADRRDGANVDTGNLTNVRPPIELDVTREWPVVRADVVVCINMIHIAPWAACEGLMSGSARVLSPGGVLLMYGPYKRGGLHTAPSNAAFDEQLRARDPRWGVRDLDDVARVAREHGLELERVAPMPANNLSVIYRAPS